MPTNALKVPRVVGKWLFQHLNLQQFCPVVTSQPPISIVKPTVACINQASDFSSADFTRLIAAMQDYIDKQFTPVWGLGAVLKVTGDFIPGAWAMPFTDDADVAGALGYHDLTPEGLPLGHVFTRISKSAPGGISCTASHELVEMLGDPSINLFGVDARDVFHAYETADAVEEDPFIFVDGLAMSNFLYPTWWEAFHSSGSTRFDHLGVLNRPFSLAPGGYDITYRDGQWSNVYGSHGKRVRFGAEDRRLHRSEQRQRIASGQPLRLSDPTV